LIAPKPKIVSIVGLTASGKSALGILLATEFNGEIISADSRQVYRGLDLGSGKVTKEEQALVPHHLLDVAEPGSRFDVFLFQQMSYKIIDDILKRGKVPIIVGGTGLYSRSIVEGYRFAARFSNEVRGSYVFGTPPDSDGEHPKNPRYNVLQICLLPPKEVIRPLVEKRNDIRLEQGMIKETEDLIKRGVSKDWLRALGLEYFWNVEYIEGKITMDEYREQLLTKVMQFAKRQRTWFKKEKNTHFLTEPEKYLSESQRFVRNFLSDKCCPCLDCGKETIHTDYYMLKHDLWKSAVPDAVPMTAEARKNLPHSDGNFLCLDCLEKRLGRELAKQDFLSVPFVSDLDKSKGFEPSRKF